MLSGNADAGWTARFTTRFPRQASAGFYRPAQTLHVSGIGIGTYLGDMTAEMDDAYTRAIVAAVNGGVNVIDTSLNYRHQRSERAVGDALGELTSSGQAARPELLVCTKAGFLTPDAIPSGVLRPEDVVGGMHSMAPAFLADQLERSRRNLGLETIDVFYLHNPETQLGFMQPDDFYLRIRAAFEFLESVVAQNKIRFYGTATWEGYRKPGQLSLDRLTSLAREVGGENHHFRFVQLPFNFAMAEALNSGILRQAEESGITVIASATLLQARLARDLPPALALQFPGLESDAQRAIQFTRSTPGISVALVGMSRLHHVDENLQVATRPSLSPQEYQGIFK